MKSKKIWMTLLVVILIVAGGAFLFRDQLLGLLPGAGEQAAQAQTPTGEPGAFNAEAMETTVIRPADSVNQVSAAGNVALSDEKTLVLEVGGVIETVTREVGETVAGGDTLAQLDITDLKRAVTQAELNLDSAQVSLDKLLETADGAEIAVAQADLTSAQENLLDVQAGPSDTEIAAAQASLAAAWAKYNDLVAGPGEDELVQLSATMEKAFIELQQAQQAYDRIAYSDNLGTSGQAATLQQATIDYEVAQAAYNESVADAGEADMQSAWKDIQTAQQSLDDLLDQPTTANLAAAEAQVASAVQQLDDLLAGSDANDLRSAEISVEKSRLELEAAQEDLAKATLVSPLDGSVLTVNISEGQQVSGGVEAFVLADLSQLELTVDVAEIDIPKVAVGHAVQIEVDALPDTSYGGEVSAIAPTGTSDGGVVYYAVTIQLTDGDLSQVRPGMTAVATILGEGGDEPTWLVPSDAVRERNGQAMVMIVRDGQPQPVQVETLGVQGEWTVVQSPDLQAGDEAVGTVTSFVDDDSATGGFGPMGGGPPDGGNRRNQ